MIILIVEDDPDALSILTTMLNFFGYKSLSSKSGKEALKILNEQAVDLVLQDLNLPDMDGLELARKIKEMRGKDFPIIATSGYVIDELKSKNLDFDSLFCDICPKPFHSNELNDLIKKHL